MNSSIVKRMATTPCTWFFVLVFAAMLVCIPGAAYADNADANTSTVSNDGQVAQDNQGIEDKGEGASQASGDGQT